MTDAAPQRGSGGQQELPKSGAAGTRFARLLREPTLHFFVLASAVLLVHHLLSGDAHTITMTPGLKADLLRRYHDQLGRPPTSAEVAAMLASWKLDEALYREALREGLERDDPTVRMVLINKMRERAALQVRTGEPSEAQLREYLEQHRADFEAPLIYEHEFISFPKSDPAAQAQRAKYQRQLLTGATPAALGLRSVAAHVNRERMVQEFGAEVAQKIAELPPGQWHELETSDRLLLVKLIRVEGGLPPPEVLHERLVGAWKAAMQQQGAEQAARAIAERYRFEDGSQ